MPKRPDAERRKREINRRQKRASYNKKNRRPKKPGAERRPRE